MVETLVKEMDFKKEKPKEEYNDEKLNTVNIYLQCTC